MLLRSIAMAACMGASGCSWAAASAVYPDGSHVWGHKPGTCESTAPETDAVIATIAGGGAVSLGAGAAFLSNKVPTDVCTDNKASCMTPQSLAITGAVAAGIAAGFYIASAKYGSDLVDTCRQEESVERKQAIENAKQVAKLQAEENVRAAQAAKLAREEEVRRQAKEEEERRVLREKQEEARVQEEAARVQEQVRLREAEIAAQEMEKARQTCQDFVSAHCHRRTVCTTFKKWGVVAGKYVNWDDVKCAPENKLTCTGTAPPNCYPNNQ